MNFLAYIFVFALFFAIAFSLYYFIRFVSSHVKAFIIRRKISKDLDTETKKDD